MARSCIRNCARFASDNRRPRTPRKGLVSLTIVKPATGLSPPASSVRIVTGRPSAHSTTRRYALYWTSSEGRHSPMNRNSVLNRPIPSQIFGFSFSRSSGSSTFRRTLIGFPDAVRAGFAANSVSILRASSTLAILVSRIFARRACAPTVTVPASPSSSIAAPLRISSRPDIPTAMGRPLDRATIAEWAVALPAPSATPAARFRSAQSISTEGPMSSATMTSPSVGSGGCPEPFAIMALSTLSRRSARSEARAAMYSLSELA